jgi:hypothetical protein
VPVPVFCCFFVSEKLYRKYCHNWTKQKPKSIFLRHEQGVQRVHRGVPRGGHTLEWRAPLSCAATRSGPPGASLPPPFRLYILGIGKTLSTQSYIHKKFHSRHRREGSGALLSTLPEGESSPEASSSPCLPLKWCVSSSSLDYGSIAVARWLSSPILCHHVRSCELPSWPRSSYL